MADTRDVDVEYLEEFLIGVLNDNFEVHVDDGSAEEVAAKIIGLRKLTLQGDFALVDEMYTKWQEKQAKGGDKRIAVKQFDGEEDQETDWDSDSSGEDNEDVEMEEAPDLVQTARTRIIPQVDEEGFTEVVSRKKR